MKTGDEKKSSKPKVLIIVDHPNWIFYRHATTLQKLLDDDFSIDIGFRGQSYQEEDCDLIYPMEYDLIPFDKIQYPNKYLTGIRSYVSWSNQKFLPFVEMLSTKFNKVHVVSKKLYDVFSPYLPGVVYASHGIDTSIFTPSKTVNEQQGTIKVGWAGNRRNPVKGFQEYVEPLVKIAGVELIYRGFSDQNLRFEEMPGFYEQIDVFLSASSYEGNNNTILEAASMERAIITTNNGTVGEYLENNKSALIVKRDLNEIIAAVEDLRDHPAKRIELGKLAREAVISHGWDWKQKVEDYRAIFWDVIHSQTGNNKKNIITLEVNSINCQHLLGIIQDQWALEYELRRGLAGTIFQLTDGKDILQALEDKSKWILELESYRDFLKNEISKKENWIQELESYRDLLKNEISKKENWIHELEVYRDLLKSELKTREIKIQDLEIKIHDLEINTIKLNAELDTIKSSRIYPLFMQLNRFSSKLRRIFNHRAT